jgi:quinol monooxygenase YgiN
MAAMGTMVIACCRPKPGKDAELLAVVREHVPVLRAEGLATGRTPVVMRAGDGTLLGVFEWKSKAAVEGAHSNPAVLALWEHFGAVCDPVKLQELQAASELAVRQLRARGPRLARRSDPR